MVLAAAMRGSVAVPWALHDDRVAASGSLLAEASTLWAGIVRVPFRRFLALTTLSNLGLAAAPSRCPRSRCSVLGARWASRHRA